MANMIKTGSFALINSKSADAEDDNGRFRITARSAQPVAGYEGDIVHDNTSVKHADRIAIDYAHGEDLIGYADRFTIENGDLVVYGRLTSGVPGDLASQILAKAKLGVPYEASIYWDEDKDTITEYYNTGEVRANGLTYAASKENPVLLIKNWRLRRVAICGSGRDANTEAHFYKKENSMQEKPVETPQAPPLEEVPKDIPKTTSIAETIAEYKREFGALGIEYLEKGLSKEDARTQYVKDLQRENEDLKKEKALSQNGITPVPTMADAKGVSGDEKDEPGWKKWSKRQKRAY